MSDACFECEITTDCEATRSAYAEYALEFLSYGPNLPRIIEAADNDPECAAVQAHAAAVYLASEGAGGFERAGTYIARAQALEDQASPRERTFIRAVSAWQRRDYRLAETIIADLAATWPEDAVALKWGQYHCFNLGNQSGLYDLSVRLADVYPDQPFVHGMEAFGLEQTYRLEEAEDAGRRAVEIEKADPWAHHAVAHVMEMQGRVEEGLDWMLSLSPTWDDRGRFIQLHNWWHVALYHMDLEDPASALRVFDERLWNVHPGFSQEIVGAVSALWRLELRGVDVGDRWQPVVDLVRERPYEHLQPFLDLHYVYALARGGSGAEVTAFLQSMAADADTRPHETCQHVWRSVTLGIARGIAAHGQGRFGAAADHMGRVIRHTRLIGGSHAQRDVFIQTYIDALLKSGAHGTARPLIEERVRARPGVEITRRLLRAVA